MSNTFQFQTRTLLAVMAMFAFGMALSVNASLGAKLSFLVSFAIFWVGVGCVTYVVDSRKTAALPSILTMLFGQLLVLGSVCAMLASLSMILRALLLPLVSNSAIA